MRAHPAVSGEARGLCKSSCVWLPREPLAAACALARCQPTTALWHTPDVRASRCVSCAGRPSRWATPATPPASSCSGALRALWLHVRCSCAL